MRDEFIARALTLHRNHATSGIVPYSSDTSDWTASSNATTIYLSIATPHTSGLGWHGLPPSLGRSAVLRREHLIDRRRRGGVQDEGPSAKSIRLSMPTMGHNAFSPFEA